MRRFRLLALALFALGSWVACQELIDLGDEPVLAESSELLCGLRAPPNQDCATCMGACCEQTLSCAADAQCGEVFGECVNRCVDVACVFACLPSNGENELVEKLLTCGADCQFRCLPEEGSICNDLGTEYCPTIVNAPIRNRCIDVALTLDEEACRLTRASLEAPAE